MRVCHRGVRTRCFGLWQAVFIDFLPFSVTSCRGSTERSPQDTDPDVPSSISAVTTETGSDEVFIISAGPGTSGLSFTTYRIQVIPQHLWQAAGCPSWTALVISVHLCLMPTFYKGRDWTRQFSYPSSWPAIKWCGLWSPEPVSTQLWEEKMQNPISHLLANNGAVCQQAVGPTCRSVNWQSWCSIKITTCSNWKTWESDLLPTSPSDQGSYSAPQLGRKCLTNLMWKINSVGSKKKKKYQVLQALRPSQIHRQKPELIQQVLSHFSFPQIPDL